MKKLLLTILIILLCVLVYVIMFNDFKLGVFQIESIADIKNKNDDLEKDLEKATKLTAQTYPQTKSTLETSANKLKTTKQQYENKISTLPNSEVLEYMQVDNYQKEFLWTTVGSYATEENIDLELDIVDIKDNDYYNLEFSAVGTYSSISKFIYAIENDDDLGFKIQNFSMKPYTVTETTKVTTYNGKTKNEDQTTDTPYDVTKEKKYTGKEDEEKEKVSTGVFGVSNDKTTEEKENTSLNNTTKTEQTNSSVTVMYSPDRVKATFTVSKVNVNVN